MEGNIREADMVDNKGEDEEASEVAERSAAMEQEEAVEVITNAAAEVVKVDRLGAVSTVDLTNVDLAGGTSNRVNMLGEF